ncbi:hypothetical protein PL9631_710027 [Planktothrix paucivesiculata PCC 9631]|uniref:Uncharacterized protein n=1 Tax=Planktothrix paucivesiculata PCC 9631 TaxID=671071 RepID=A0A7Z9BVB2_9CYAN|nr:hypothetical protein PL9631_710027 [Planktothrix paucivesiculata PCC 9631]
MGDIQRARTLALPLLPIPYSLLPQNFKHNSNRISICLIPFIRLIG